MRCRFCGMESRTVDVCEWCKKPLAANLAGTQPSGQPAQPPAGQPQPAPMLNAPALTDVTQRMPAPGGPMPPASEPTRIMRTTLTGEVIEVTTPVAAPPQFAPPPGAMSPGAVPSYPPAGAAVTGARTAGQMRDQEWPQTREVSNGERFELFLAICLPLLLGSVLLVHAMPHLIMGALFVDLFVFSLILGATGAVPDYDDSATALRPIALWLGALFVIFFLFLFVGISLNFLNVIPYGNMIWVASALVIYGVVGLVQQEWNIAIIGMLTLDLIVDGCLTRAALAGAAKVPVIAWLTWGPLCRLCAAFVGMGGWVLSNFLRPVEARE
jgi:hypothetical protein